ncbi:CLUMA_CG020825, isoform A [Clunio marinus]|uniref:CLUMA_CG020825, isoform A n=1 Tax=Clunio marinus TaxID=568069 RepID=A0A1J1JAN2_9DIPT|nr:CLUMA_CG020825, isoform A [Clunio marinus]
MASFKNHGNSINFKCFQLLNNESFVDVSIVASGRYLQAHKLVLAAASSYFEEIFKIIPNSCTHPVIVLNIPYIHLQYLMQYIYCGYIDIESSEVNEFQKLLNSMNVEYIREDIAKEDNQILITSFTEDSIDENDITSMTLSERQENEEREAYDFPEDLQAEDESPQPIHNLQLYNNRTSTSSIKSNPPKEKSGFSINMEGKHSVKRVVPSQKFQNFMFKNPTICPFCNKFFNTTKHRNEHVKYCFDNPNRVVSQCKICSKSVCDPYYLRKHMKNVHGKNADPYVRLENRQHKL